MTDLLAIIIPNVGSLIPDGSVMKLVALTHFLRVGREI